MNFCELAQQRSSVRAYKNDPVEPEKLQMVLEAARIAPTACNLQPFRLIVIPTAGREEALNRIYRPKWFVQAPLLICACGIATEGWVRADGRAYLPVDVAIAMDHLILQAADLGLGTCWVADFHVEAAREVLGIPAEIEPLIFTPLGYPAGDPRPKTRRPLTDLVKYDHW